MPRTRLLVAPIPLVLTASLLGGCVITSKNVTRETGTKVPPHALNTVVVDRTTEAQLLETLGTPTRSMAAEDEGVIYVWEHTRVHHSRGSLLFVFGGSTEKSEESSTSALVRNGVVRSVWSG